MELEAHPEINANTCFMDQTDPACVFDADALLASLTKDDIGYRMCVLVGMREGFAGKVKFGTDWANTFLDRAQKLMGGKLDAMPLNILTGGVLPLINDIKSTINYVGGEQSFHHLLSDQDLIVRNRDEKVLESADMKCQALFPNSVPMSKKVVEMENSPLDLPHCYSGSIGELALAARAAAKDIEKANSELQDLIDAYDIATNSCIILEAAVAQKAEIRTAMKAIAKQLKAVKRASDAAFSLAETTTGCALNGDITAIGRMFDAGFKHFWDNAKKQVALAIPLDKVQKQHDLVMTQIDEDVAVTTCFNDAELHLVGARTQGLEIERLKLELSANMVALNNAQEEMAQLAFEGHQRVAREAGRASTSLFNDIWKDMGEFKEDEYDTNIYFFRRDMAIARRATYLAVKAVEYELQLTSTSWTTDVLAADLPNDLNEVLIALRTELATGASIAGNIASELQEVVSLKDHLLQLVNMEDFPDGRHRPNETERLQAMFTSPRYAVYDEDGDYKGQQFPITIMPTGTFNLGQSFGISLLTGSDCAERLWSVAATIHGEDLVVGDGAASTRITLKQKNTFYSQWCSEKGEDFDDLQVATVRPAKNLFKDPVWGGEDAVTEGTDVGQNDYKTSRIVAYHNVDKNDFSHEDYDDGESEDLRCRGLYGDYALFIDKDFLSLDGAEGLNLTKVDDILLRFDYLSVAKD